MDFYEDYKVNYDYYEMFQEFLYESSRNNENAVRINYYSMDKKIQYVYFVSNRLIPINTKIKVYKKAFNIYAEDMTELYSNTGLYTEDYIKEEILSELHINTPGGPGSRINKINNINVDENNISTKTIEELEFINEGSKDTKRRYLSEKLKPLIKSPTPPTSQQKRPLKRTGGSKRIKQKKSGTRKTRHR